MTIPQEIRGSCEVPLGPAANRTQFEIFVHDPLRNDFVSAVIRCAWQKQARTKHGRAGNAIKTRSAGGAVHRRCRTPAATPEVHFQLRPRPLRTSAFTASKSARNAGFFSI